MVALMRMKMLLRVASVVGLAGLGGSVGGAERRLVEPGVYRLGSIESRAIKESSGVVNSRVYGGVFWTHNDGGGALSRVLYAIDRNGKLLASFRLEGIDLADWEDLALDGEGQLYIGDFGNNDLERTTMRVYRVKEPDPKSSGVVTNEQTWRLSFPGKPFNCESLFIWEGHGYVISKVTDDERAEIYRFALGGGLDGQVLEWVARLEITSPVTGADLSVDGRFLAVVAKAGAYVFRVDGKIERAGGVEPRRKKFKKGQIEGCCFVAEGLLATSESREIFLFTGLTE